MGRGRGFPSLWGCLGASWLGGGIPAGLLQGWGQRGDSPTCGGLDPCPAAPALLHRRPPVVPPEVGGPGRGSRCWCCVGWGGCARLSLAGSAKWARGGLGPPAPSLPPPGSSVGSGELEAGSCRGGGSWAISGGLRGGCGLALSLPGDPTGTSAGMEHWSPSCTGSVVLASLGSRGAVRTGSHVGGGDVTSLWHPPRATRCSRTWGSGCAPRGSRDCLRAAGRAGAEPPGPALPSAGCPTL